MQKTQAIITELEVSLDMEKGGEIAKNLMALYVYFNEELMNAGINKNKEKFVNNILHFFAVIKGANDKWMMFPKRKFWTFFANILYSIIVLAIVVYLYTVINLLINTISGPLDQLYFGVEPVAFGLLYVAVDMVFIGMKNLVIKIISDAKEKTNVK